MDSGKVILILGIEFTLYVTFNIAD
jgi:hypothetical protein